MDRERLWKDDVDQVTDYKVDIPVNLFVSRRDFELHSLMNGFVGVIFILLGIASWFLTESLAILCSLLIAAILWILVFVVFTHIYSNGLLKISIEGLSVGRLGYLRTFSWKQVDRIRFVRIHTPMDPTFPPVLIRIELADSSEIIEVQLNKYRFQLPRTRYKKVVSFLNTIPNTNDKIVLMD
jgi:hypothetical protein